MKKMMTVSFAALMAAGIAGAQDEMVMTGMAPAAPAEPEVTAEVALLSSYVWRGQVYNGDAVVQPQLTISHYDFSFNIWGNYDAGGSNSSGVSDDFSEIDLSLAYSLPLAISDMEVSVGVVHYTFPNVLGAESTTELFANGTITTLADLPIPIIPSVTIFGDVDEVNGTYVLFDVNTPYAISDYLTVAGGVSAGYGNTSYNDAYFGAALDSGFNDYNFYANVNYEIVENVTASLNLTYTMLEGGGVRDGAEANYDAKEKAWGGFNIAYDF